MALLESIAAGLLIHAGRKTMDWAWAAIKDGQKPVVSENGQVGLATIHNGRALVDKAFTVSGYQKSELIFGNLFLPNTLIDFVDDEIPLVLVVEETQQQTFFFTADLNEGYELYLPHGTYSFYVLLIDALSDDILDAAIYAVGYPSVANLTDISNINVRHHEDIWNILVAAPIQVTYGGPFTLDFVLVDTDDEPELPDFFSELVDAHKVCDMCLYDDVYSADWKFTNKGNFKCTECGEKNDFAECERCDSIWFRETKKGNYRCLNCDKKLKFP